ncbi:TlpA family protein disulfide reductase, partial [Xanthomonas citri pv. citri]|nr:TlpA family protein disulfide reductase [Xanthomonas citri pv. citri]
MQTPRPSRRTVLTGLSLAGLAPVLAACSGDDSLTRQAGNADGKNYIAGDGSVLEIAPEERGAPV